MCCVMAAVILSCLSLTYTAFGSIGLRVHLIGPDPDSHRIPPVGTGT